ncbi:MAG: hypothetical protein KDE22_03745 [Rhodobacterales bacterium]|nr:hypothetical protein [Rhodobacterales bacterium]
MSMLARSLLTLALAAPPLAVAGTAYWSGEDAVLGVVDRLVPMPLMETAAPPPKTSPSQAAQAAVQDLPRVKPLPPDSRFAVITNRPVFSPTRRPPEPKPEPPVPVAKAAPAEPEIETGQYRLIGVIIDEGGSIALVKDKRSPDMLRVSVGDTLAGWTVEKVEADSITLRQDDVVDQVLLRDNIVSPNDRRQAQGANPPRPNPPRANPPKANVPAVRQQAPAAPPRSASRGRGVAPRPEAVPKTAVNPNVSRVPSQRIRTAPPGSAPE